jgi:hypothetical protein
LSEQAVSELNRRGVVRPGDSLGEQVRCYCEHLRAVAAGRVEDPTMAAERTALTRAKREREEHRLAIERREALWLRDHLRVVRALVGWVVERFEVLPSVAGDLVEQDLATIQNRLATWSREQRQVLAERAAQVDFSKADRE